jgi:hypothetical protein
MAKSRKQAYDEYKKKGGVKSFKDYSAAATSKARATAKKPAVKKSVESKLKKYDALNKRKRPYSV